MITKRKTFTRTFWNNKISYIIYNFVVCLRINRGTYCWKRRSWWFGTCTRTPNGTILQCHLEKSNFHDHNHQDKISIKHVENIYIQITTESPLYNKIQTKQTFSLWLYIIKNLWILRIQNYRNILFNFYKIFLLFNI